MKERSRKTLAAHALVIAAGFAPPSLLRAQTLVLRGHVTTATGASIRGAVIAATGLGERMSRSALTDSLGDYRLTITNAVEGYILAVTKAGYAIDRRQITRPARDTATVTVDVQLVPAPVLDSMRTLARRPGPRRDERGLGAPNIGENRTTVPLGSGASGDLTGSLDAALSLVPGIGLTPDGSGALRASAFGLGSDQIGVTLNGADVSGLTTAPRDGLIATVRLSTYDPRQGRAAGPIVSLTLPSGSYVVTRGLHASIDDPALQASPRIVSRLGAEYARQIVSGTASGPLGTSGRRFYDATAQLDRRTNDLTTLTTLTTADAATLAALGADPDSVARALALAARLGVPLSAPGLSATHTATSGSAMARVDFTPGFAPAFGGSNLPVDGNVFYLLGYGRWSGSDANGAFPLGTSSRLAESRQRSGQLLADYETYRGPALHVTKSSLTLGDDRTTPLIDVPGASVLTTASDGAVTGLSFGGGSAASHSRTLRWQTTSDLTWESDNLRHFFDVYGDVLYDRATASQSANALGTFTYASLADFATGVPTEFDRTFASRDVDGRAWKGVLAASDVWRPHHVPWLFTENESNRLLIQYGVRADVERFGAPVASNALVASRFGRSTTTLPHDLVVEPMAGFTWTIGQGIANVGGSEARGWAPHTITGGIREYGGTLMPLAVGSVARQSGSVDAIATLRCIGTAVPTPNWAAYTQSTSAIPARCSDGSAASPFVESAPSVAFYTSDYTPLRSWRGELRWQWKFSRSFASTLGVVQSLNYALPSSIDLNLVSEPRFTLRDERARAVFVDPLDIVPSTGDVAVTASRLAPELSRVRELRSDARSSQRQLTIGLTRWYGVDGYVPLAQAPPRFVGTVDASYTLADTRARMRGFEATTAGDPRAFAWSAAPDPRHTVLLTLTGRLEGWLSLSASARLSSGVAYTPLVRGDVNGDGAFDDRAFVFDPASTTDSALGTSMRSLLMTAPGRVRACLTRQLGAVATQASCRGPWFASLGTVSLSLDPHRFGLGNRGAVTLHVNNALGGIDQLLHGSDRLHGWGQYAVPDAALLTVRGFDPQTRRYRYVVNPHFGQTTVDALPFRQPTALTLDVRLDVSPNRETQELTHLFRPAPAGRGYAQDTVDARRYLGGYSNSRSNAGELGRLLENSAKFSLTTAQVDSIRAVNRRLRRTRDSIYDDLGRYLLTSGRDYRAKATREYWHRSIVAAATQLYDAGQLVRALLTPEQYTAIQSQRFWPIAMLDYTPAWLARIADGVSTSPR